MFQTAVRPWWLLAGALSLAAVPCALRAQNPADLTPREKTEIFIQHLVKVAKVDPAKYRALVLEYEIGSALLEAAPEKEHAEHGDEPERDHPGAKPAIVVADFIETALKEIHPEYAEALKLRDEKKLDPAREKARDLAGKADPYLAAHAGLLLSELDFLLGPSLLEAVIARAEKTCEKDRLYLIRDHRACELIALAFERLKKPLHELLQYAILLTDYPELPPEVEGRARARLAALEAEAGKPLGTVADWMNGVEKLLGQEVTSKDPTQARETEIVSALDKLIELQEARERKSCSNCGSGSCQGSCRNGRPKGNRSRSPARVSALAQAEGEVLLHGVSRADASTIWGQLREKDASRTLQSFKGKLPPRYERLLEQYYKNLSRYDTQGEISPAAPSAGNGR